jgi:tetratricopeptide (TPR) repeat protein
MNRLIVTFTAAVLLAGCSSITHHNENLYENPFYAKYLDGSIPLDARIATIVDALRTQQGSAPLHNELGQLLVTKGFPKDAEEEFERAIDADRRFYPAWYNLGLIRASAGNTSGSRRAFARTLHYKPGHGAALFQMALIAEERGNTDEAISLYAKAYRIDRKLLDVSVNPRVLDSKLTHLALLELYPVAHARQTMNFDPTPAGYVIPEHGASPQTNPADIVTPTAPATDQGKQTPPPGE